MNNVFKITDVGGTINETKARWINFNLFTYPGAIDIRAFDSVRITKHSWEMFSSLVCRSRDLIVNQNGWFNGLEELASQFH